MRVPVMMFLALLIPAPARGEASESAAARDMAAVFPETDYSPMSPGVKFHICLQSTVWPMPIFASAFSAGYGQTFNSVPEWGQGMEGYGRRFAFSFGQKTIRHTVNSGLKILLREDPRYFYSERHGIRARTLHAVGETFVAHKDSGGIRPDYSYFAGVFSGVYLSRQWRPESDQTAVWCVKDAAVTIAVQSMKNVFMEFWPDVKKKFWKRAKSK